MRALIPARYQSSQDKAPRLAVNNAGVTEKMVEGVNLGAKAAVLDIGRGAGTNFAAERAACVVVRVIGAISVRSTTERAPRYYNQLRYPRQMLRAFASPAVWRKSRERRQR